MRIPNPLDKLVRSLALAALAGFATNAHAAIPVGAAGSGTFTFDALPTASEWSMLSVSGGSGDVETDAALDTAMSTIAASSIAGTLASQAGSGTNGSAYWRSGDLKLGTQPTGNKMTLLMARLQNSSGDTIDSLTVAYTLGLPTVTPGELIKGHRLYWSKTGAAGTWTAAGDYLLAATGTKAISFDLAPLAWGDGETLHVVWADDNGVAGSDGDYTIDDVSFAKTIPAANILTFGLPGNPAAIDQGTQTIGWTVPDGTNVLALAPTFTLSFGATCDHDSGITEYDFSSPVHYIVTSSDALVIRNYTVTVTVAPPASADASTVTASSAFLPADGTTTSTITVTLKNLLGNPVADKTVTLVSSRTVGVDTIVPDSGVSGSNGVVTFTVKSATPGAPVFTATDTTDTLEISQKPTVKFQPLITWGPATNDTLNAGGTAFEQSDVKTDGTFVAAVTTGIGGTLNGVTFQRWTAFNSQRYIVFGSSPISMAWAPNAGRNQNGWGSPTNAYGNYGYDNGTATNLLLTGGGEGDSPGTLTLGTLVSNHQYQVQIWAPSWNQSFNTTVGGVALRIADPPARIPQYMVGTFTADDTGSQLIQWSGIAPCGVSLRDLTAAATYADWAIAHGIPGEPASGDYDNDGLTNLMEYALGLAPTVPGGSPGSLVGGLLTFTKGTDAVTNNDVTYAIEESDDLGLTDPWTEVASYVDNNSTTISHALPPGRSKTFARLVVTHTTP
ncbi:MAG: Ig-like domain-containing protein [Verrucomicrobia bacterium]|nr:Ig-like domain-containing protein [Verrucomicrobiota bacterium]